MPNYIDLKQFDYTMIGRGTCLIGKVNFHGPTHISGKIEGDVKMQEEADLCIQPYGVIEGKIIGHNIEVYGKVEGEIQASGKVTLHASSNVKGQVKAANLIIKPGALMDATTYAGTEL